MNLSIIFPVYNETESLPRLYQALHDALDDQPYSWEAIFVDDGSSDGSARVLEELAYRDPEHVRVVLLRRNFGQTAAIAAGIDHAQGEVLLFTDADCVPCPDWVQALVDCHRAGMWAVGGPLRNGTPESAVGSAEFLLERHGLQNDRGVPRLVENLDTGNVSYRAELFARYGKFTGAIKGSDSVFSRTIRGQGIELWLVPHAPVYHRNRTTLEGFLRNQFEVGLGAAITRRRLALRDSFLVHLPMAWLLIPVARTLVMAVRLLRWSPKNLLRLLLLYPLVFLGLLVFTAGFVRGRRRR